MTRTRSLDEILCLQEVLKDKPDDMDLEEYLESYYDGLEFNFKEDDAQEETTSATKTKN